MHDDGDSAMFMDSDAFDSFGWMDDRWNEDDYGFGLVIPAGGGGMDRSAGEKMTTPMNHVEV